MKHLLSARAWHHSGSEAAAATSDGPATSGGPAGAGAAAWEAAQCSNATAPLQAERKAPKLITLHEEARIFLVENFLTDGASWGPKEPAAQCTCARGGSGGLMEGRQGSLACLAGLLTRAWRTAYASATQGWLERADSCQSASALPSTLSRALLPPPAPPINEERDCISWPAITSQNLT